MESRRRFDAKEFSLLIEEGRAMNAEQVVELSRQTIAAAFWVAAPILLSAMVVGLVINIGQVMTSIQDMTVSTVPRLAAVGGILFFLTPWMLHRLVIFTELLFRDFRVYTQ
jgi:flagellar biosynthesis protein FliQ